jgi:hypothetical protein
MVKFKSVVVYRKNVTIRLTHKQKKMKSTVFKEIKIHYKVRQLCKTKYLQIAVRIH